MSDWETTPFRTMEKSGKTMAGNGNNVTNQQVKKNNAASWKRPAGPLNVWRVVEMKKLGDGKDQPVRLSIQEIPEDRYDDAVNFMCEYFIKDEVICRAFKINEDEDAMNAHRTMWNYLLRQGMSVGAFVLDSNNSPGELAGMNVLYVATDETGDIFDNITNIFKSSKLKKIFKFMQDVSEKADVGKIYGVDKYIGALGLTVKPAFRGQRLGVLLLEARNDIGRKYGITATSTHFTGPSSQLQAERAGFITAVSQEYALVMDVDGRPMFPNIEAKSIKVMIKELK